VRKRRRRADATDSLTLQKKSFLQLLMQRQPTENTWSLLAKRNETHPSTRHASDIRPLAGDLRHASRAGRNGEPEAVQFGHGRDEAEARPNPGSRRLLSER